MKVLILSCNTGGGHNSVAAALTETFKKHGDSCITKDALAFISTPLSQLVSKGHNFLYRYFPELVSQGFDKAGDDPNLFDPESAERMLLDAGVDRMARYIKEGGFDLIICPHIFSSVMVADAENRFDLGLPAARVETDYMISPGANKTGMDFHFQPTEELADEWKEKGFFGKAIVSGIPVRDMFYRRKDSVAAKRELGIPESSRHLLIMSGSMGAGPVPKIAGHIARYMDADMQLSVVCGSNRAMYNELMTYIPPADNVHIYGFCDNIPLLMDSAELLMTKPGGISITEAAVKTLPMVLIDAVAGCEKPNMEYFLRNGYAITGDDPIETAEGCMQLLSNDQSRREMAYALKHLADINDKEIIYETLKKEASGCEVNPFR